MKKIDVLEKDVECLDGVIDEVKTTVFAHDRELKDLKTKLEGHRHNPDPYSFIIRTHGMRQGPDGLWECERCRRPVDMQIVAEPNGAARAAVQCPRCGWAHVVAPAQRVFRPNYPRIEWPCL